MPYEWDDAKAAINRKKHGVELATVEEFDWDTALVVPDDRLDYGETRWLALRLIGKRLFSLAFTLRGNRIRVISLRRTSRKERKLYDGQNQG